MLGYRFGNIAYCTDVNGIPDASLAQLGGLDVLVLDALRVKFHPTHFNLSQAVEMAQRFAGRPMANERWYVDNTGAVTKTAL